MDEFRSCSEEKTMVGGAPCFEQRLRCARERARIGGASCVGARLLFYTATRGRGMGTVGRWSSVVGRPIMKAWWWRFGRGNEGMAGVHH
jgi:hypothetical protein